MGGGGGEPVEQGTPLTREGVIGGTVGSPILYKIHLTFLEALLCEIAQSQSRKSLEKTLTYLTLHLQL